MVSDDFALYLFLPFLMVGRYWVMSLPELYPRVGDTGSNIDGPFTSCPTTVGSKVKHVNVGDRVAMEPGATCSRYHIKIFRYLLNL